jgi:RNA-binding protein YhbY
MIGDNGLTEPVLKELERSLLSHELIKVRVSVEGRPGREQILAAICSQLSASPVQAIGKILVIYRENPDKPEPATPTPARKAVKRPEPRRPKKAFQAR